MQKFFLLYFYTFSPHVGVVAQLVEQRTENSRVVGSIPTLATIFRRPHRLSVRTRAFHACKRSSTLLGGAIFENRPCRRERSLHGLQLRLPQ